MNNKPVLYAEDEASDAFFLRRAFARVGVKQELIVVSDGQEAIDYLLGDVPYLDRSLNPLPCLVILDLNMPRKSGLDVLKRVRDEPRISTLPIIILTSSLHDADIHRAHILGANAYFVKPSNPAELVGIVKTINDSWLTHSSIPEISWSVFDGKPLGEGKQLP